MVPAAAMFILPPEPLKPPEQLDILAYVAMVVDDLACKIFIYSLEDVEFFKKVKQLDKTVLAEYQFQEQGSKYARIM